MLEKFKIAICKIVTLIIDVKYRIFHIYRGDLLCFFFVIQVKCNNRKTTPHQKTLEY